MTELQLVLLVFLIIWQLCNIYSMDYLLTHKKPLYLKQNGDIYYIAIMFLFPSYALWAVRRAVVAFNRQGKQLHAVNTKMQNRYKFANATSNNENV